MNQGASLCVYPKVFLKDLPEMKPVDREGNGLRKEAGTTEYGPEQKTPIMASLFPDDPQDN